MVSGALANLHIVAQADAERVRAALSPAILDASRMTRMRLIDLSLLCDLLSILNRHVPASGQQALWRAVFCAELRTRLFRTAAAAALAILGPSPGSLVKWLPRSWPHLFRNCGIVTIEANEPGFAIARILGVPLKEPDRTRFAAGCAGCLTGFFDLCETAGEIEYRVSGSELDFMFHWDV